MSGYMSIFESSMVHNEHKHCAFLISVRWDSGRGRIAVSRPGFGNPGEIGLIRRCLFEIDICKRLAISQNKRNAQIMC